MNSTKQAIFLLKLNSRQSVIPARRYAKSKSLQDAEAIENMPVYQYATENRKRKKRVYMWGNTLFGALGYSNLVYHKHPFQSLKRPWRLPFAELHKVLDVSCGYGFTVLAASNQENDFSLFGTGLNSEFQIGYHCAKKNRPLEIVAEPAPIALPLSDMSAKAIKVGCGRAHTVVVTDKEGVFSLGNNSYGQCGVPSELNAQEASILKVHKVPDISESIEQVVCGQDHSLLLTSEGKIFSFGWGADGQTGLGHYENQFTPCQVRGDIEGERIVQLSCAADCVLAVSDKGDVFGWGNSEYTQLNSATDEQQIHTPRALKLNIGKVKQVASAGTMCAALNEKGQVYVWGYGILGQGPNVSRSKKPVLLPAPLFGINEFSEDTEVSQVTCGLSHFAAITNKGHLYMWGKNRNNCLGLDRSGDQFFPLMVAVPSEVIKVSCGIDHTAALCRSFT